MIYGVEQSTDQRCPRTEIKKFSSEKQAMKWKNKDNGKLTYADPEGARNYHHTFKSIYYLEGRIDKKDSIMNNEGSRDYPRNTNDNIAFYLYKYGEEIK